jgi:hypothetical protein
MPTDSLSGLARRYFHAFVARERQFYEDTLAEDFTFSSPLDDHIDRAAYFERCWPNGDRMKSIEVEKTFENGAEVCVRYKAELTNGKVIRNTEILRFEGARLAEVDVYFGRTLREAPETGDRA